MKLPIAITFLCASFFACQAANQAGQNNSISVETESSATSIESTETIDASFLEGPIPVSSIFTPDGPNGPEPYTCQEGTSRNSIITQTVGEGCCGEKGIQDGSFAQPGPAPGAEVANTPGGGCCGPHAYPSGSGPGIAAIPTPR